MIVQKLKAELPRTKNKISTYRSKNPKIRNNLRSVNRIKFRVDQHRTEFFFFFELQESNPKIEKKVEVSNF